jgi:hypothetical protein
MNVLPRYYLFICLSLIVSLQTKAQADAEIQVYSSPTVDPKTTMFELHSNYTFKGSYAPYEIRSHYLNESLEITHGFTNNFEMGLYLFTTLDPEGHYQYLGSHIRPRISVPDTWHWPFGASLSVEFGFFRPTLEVPFHWEGEIRPILDRTFKNWYISFNPNINFVLNSAAGNVWALEPQLKTVYSIQGKYGLGIEYYSELGTFQYFFPMREQTQLIGPAFDLYTSPKWELNAAFLFGLTPGSVHQVLKLIIGRHAGNEKVKSKRS